MIEIEELQKIKLCSHLIEPPAPEVIGRLVDELMEANNVLDFHGRAAKLMKKKKEFLVVAEDEPYYIIVYQLIRINEKRNGRWDEVDEKLYLFALEKYNKREV